MHVSKSLLPNDLLIIALVKNVLMQGNWLMSNGNRLFPDAPTLKCCHFEMCV